MNLVSLRKTLLLVLTASIWGLAFVAQTVGADFVGTFTFLALRNWVAAFAILLVIFVRDRLMPASKDKQSAPAEKPSESRLAKTYRGWPVIGGALCGVILCVASAAQQAGIPLTTTAKAGFITAMYVVIVPLLNLFFGSRARLKIWLCMALSVVGLYLLCMKGGFSLAAGDALVLLCALLFALHILTIDRVSPHVDGLKLSCVQFFVCAALSTVCMFIFETPSISGILSAAPSILYAGLLSSAVGYTLQIVAQKGLDPTIASLAMCLESVFSALAGWALLGQSLTEREILGCALMFTAIVISQLPDRRIKPAQSGEKTLSD